MFVFSDQHRWCDMNVYGNKQVLTPNFDKFAKKAAVFEQWENPGNWLAYPNPVSDYLVLQKRIKSFKGTIQIAFYSLDGKMIYNEIRPDESRIVLRNLNMLNPGIFLMQIISDNLTETIKIKKIP